MQYLLILQQFSVDCYLQNGYCLCLHWLLIVLSFLFHNWFYTLFHGSPSFSTSWYCFYYCFSDCLIVVEWPLILLYKLSVLRFFYSLDGSYMHACTTAHCMHTFIHPSMCVCIYAYIIFLHIYMCVCVCVCVCLCIYIYIIFLLGILCINLMPFYPYVT